MGCPFIRNLTESEALDFGGEVGEDYFIDLPHSHGMGSMREGVLTIYVYELRKGAQKRKKLASNDLSLLRPWFKTIAASGVDEENPESLPFWKFCKNNSIIDQIWPIGNTHEI